MPFNKKNSIESLYIRFKQYNTTVAITFKPGSKAYQNYGEYIIGTFRYSPKERKVLQDVTNKNFDINTSGIIPFNVSDINVEWKINEIKEFEMGSFHTDEILSVSGYLANV